MCSEPADFLDVHPSVLFFKCSFYPFYFIVNVYIEVSLAVTYETNVMQGNTKPVAQHAHVCCLRYFIGLHITLQKSGNRKQETHAGKTHYQ